VIRTRPVIILTLVAAAVLAGPAATGAEAGVDDFRFESMHVDFELGREADGTATLRAVETIVAVFPQFDQNRGIVRTIPISYGRVDIGFHLVGVTDEQGASVPIYSTSTWTDFDGTRFIDIALGTDDFVYGRTTYVIEWTARDVVRQFADTGSDEFYWDINGTGWAQEFGSVSAEVHLAPGLQGALTGATSCYWGYEDSGERCPVSELPDGFSVAVPDIGPYQNVTLAIGFEPGTFRTPLTIDEHGMVRIVPWVLLGILGALTLLIVVLRTFVWRHAPGRGIIVPEYEGPEGFGVMKAAELLRRPKAGLPAQIVAFAVRGIARLVEDPDLPPTKRFRLEIIDRSAATEPDDDAALRKLFASKARDGEDLLLDRDNRKLGDRVASLTRGASAELRSRGYLARGTSPLRRVIFWPALACFVGGWVVVGWCGLNDVGSGLLTAQVLVILLGSLVVMGFTGMPEGRTASGTAVYEHLLGLRDYLRLAEADRLRVLQSPQGASRHRIDPTNPAAVVRLYEQLLPWAMVWGLEREWAEVIGSRYAETAPPSTNLSFASSGLTSISTFSSSLAPSGFQRTPPVSSSSSSSGSGGSSFSGGSSGGGSSGGGGGGGGGGGR
jgi:uncharacterized membrane protein YgcG